jgi:hypothetical protein
MLVSVMEDPRYLAQYCLRCSDSLAALCCLFQLVSYLDSNVSHCFSCLKLLPSHGVLTTIMANMHNFAFSNIKFHSPFTCLGLHCIQRSL